ncbi:MAG: hypothetical protein K9M45_07305, partial [Kiritimatiellales bacterium]|nr:hypothetical protein [Kiritimatiellales bacterium]
VPDRNWNYADPATRALKAANLKAMVTAADGLDMPINIGTEMNKAGLPFVDDLAGEVLGEFKDTFLRGAQIMVGHTIAARFAGRSYAKCQCDNDRKIALFSSIGALPPLTGAIAGKLQALENETAFEKLKACADAGSWQPLG